MSFYISKKNFKIGGSSMRELYKSMIMEAVRACRHESNVLRLSGELADLEMKKVFNSQTEPEQSPEKAFENAMSAIHGEEDTQKAAEAILNDDGPLQRLDPAKLRELLRRCGITNIDNIVFLNSDGPKKL
jgi:hypothetical protein